MASFSITSFHLDSGKYVKLVKNDTTGKYLVPYKHFCNVFGMGKKAHASSTFTNHGTPDVLAKLRLLKDHEVLDINVRRLCLYDVDDVLDLHKNNVDVAAFTMEHFPLVPIGGGGGEKKRDRSDQKKEKADSIIVVKKKNKSDIVDADQALAGFFADHLKKFEDHIDARFEEQNKKIGDVMKDRYVSDNKAKWKQEHIADCVATWKKEYIARLSNALSNVK